MYINDLLIQSSYIHKTALVSFLKIFLVIFIIIETKTASSFICCQRPSTCCTLEAKTLKKQGEKGKSFFFFEQYLNCHFSIKVPLQSNSFDVVLFILSGFHVTKRAADLPWMTYLMLC